jgi:hypothetical protein
MILTSDLATGGAYSCVAYHEFNAPSTILKGNFNSPRIIAYQATSYQVGSYAPEVVKTFGVASSQGLVSVLKDASHNARVYVNGTESSSGQQNVGSGSFPFTMLSTGASGGAANGKLVEVIYYNSDQSDNRTAIEANIGETYGITDIPAADDTVNGFVQTWYDQSGSGNDAEQISATKQPIIVSEGQLVTNTSGNAAIAMYRRYIDGAQNNRYLSMSSGVTADGSTSFAAVEYRRNYAYHLTGTAQDANTRVGNYAGSGFHMRKGGTSVDEASPKTLTLNEQHLVTTLFAESGGTSKGRVNGDERISANLPDASSTGLLLKFLFRGDNDQRNPLLYSELVLYDSDQSSNIPAIEANIANQYGITLS